MFKYEKKTFSCISLENVEEKSDLLSVEIDGIGLTSYCHLEIDNQDFSSENEYPENTRAIFLECVGLPANCKRFVSLVEVSNNKIVSHVNYVC